MRDIRAIGSHGQNVWHQPGGDKPVTIQLGRGDLIARNTGTSVVNNFRSADVMAGGQGAPLAPLLHQHIFHSEQEDRAIVNLGGIANLTILPAKGAAKGFDCGPGNCLMDTWTRRHLQKDYDDRGRWAAKGEYDPGLLNRMLADPYFSLPPPKSTGLEYFNFKWLERMLGQAPPTAINVQSTLAELCARGVALSLAEADLPDRLLVCGGGIHNDFLMDRIAALLAGVAVESTGMHGIDPDWVEGVLFAWLARERLNGRLLDTSNITGAKNPVLLGEVHDP
jgi:anhydro-N-acetylmuramic acid kinase